MIPLEKQVCSLALAKRLKELGVKQESYFAWHWSRKEGELADLITSDGQNTHYMFAAFTVAELGEMLPWRIETSRGFYFLKWEAGGKPWHWISYVLGDNDDVWTEEADTEADAHATMVGYLVEKKIITL